MDFQVSLPSKKSQTYANHVYDSRIGQGANSVEVESHHSLPQMPIAVNVFENSPLKPSTSIKTHTFSKTTLAPLNAASV